MNTVEWRVKHAGDLVPVCGFEVICWRCTGGIAITVPVAEFDLDDVMHRVEQSMVRTARGWLCKGCAGNIGALLPVWVNMREGGGILSVDRVSYRSPEGGGRGGIG